MSKVDRVLIAVFLFASGIDAGLVLAGTRPRGERHHSSFFCSESPETAAIFSRYLAVMGEYHNGHFCLYEDEAHRDGREMDPKDWRLFE